MSFIRDYFDRRHAVKSAFLEDISDDVSAVAYYGSFGLIDPKAPFVDAPALSAARGMSYWKSLMMVSGIGFLAWGFAGWIVDPADKREGGLWESEVFQSAWEPITEGWEMGRESEQPWWL